jgi:hypothetical protein
LQFHETFPASKRLFQTGVLITLSIFGSSSMDVEANPENPADIAEESRNPA